ncbi:type VI secretion system tube protein TssD [uncultured Spirosoma sp.]|uniref:type VI secretion system tube protein TssD n=1 Tax=uncultured Spirosoma sp. TaxID=278208 RepID=UPI0025830CFD|nr:type VI secretion system tube protein TssD [uncultured Spirosoma sp.]
MASFRARFLLGSLDVPLNYVYLDINQAVDSLGRPASLTRGGKITLEFNATDDNIIAEWMANPAKRLNGKIRFVKLDNVESTEKELTFENAYCVELMERFDGTTTTSQMVTVITISPEFIHVGTTTLDNRWPATA